MKHKIIKTDNNLLIVSNEEIKEGDWVFNDISKEIYQFTENYVPYEKKIIAHLPINDSSILEGVDLLPSLEDEVEKLAKEYYQKYLLSPHHGDGAKQDYIDCVKFGYNKTKEKYKYTEEDLKKAIEISKDIKYVTFSIDEIIKSLQQSKYPVAFESEMEINNCDGCRANAPFDGYYHRMGSGSYPDLMVCQKNKYNKVKITNNLQGQNVWSGKYIY